MEALILMQMLRSMRHPWILFVVVKESGNFFLYDIIPKMKEPDNNKVGISLG